MVLEHEDAVRETVVSTLRRSGFSVDAAIDPAQADSALERIFPCLILLGGLVPGVGAVEHSRRLSCHETTRDVPMILFVAPEEERDCISGLERRIVDYMIRPVCVRELVARVKAVLDRVRSGVDAGPLMVDGLRLEPGSRRVTCCGKAVDLEPAEYRMLYLFMRNPGRAFTRSQLLESVWGRNVYVEESIVDAHVDRLRKALSALGDGDFIRITDGSCYRLFEPLC